MTLYQTKARNLHGVDGTVELSSGKQVATNHPLGQGQGFNPEELIALAWSTCLNATIKALLEGRNLGHLDSRVDVIVSLEKEMTGSGFYFQVDGKVSIKGMGQEEGQKIMQQAHKRCPVSKLMTKAETLSLTYLEWQDEI